MKNPFVKKMPLRVQLVVLRRLFWVWCSKVYKKVAWIGIAFVVPAFTLWLFMFQPATDPVPTTLITNIRTAQLVEQQKAEGAIYYVKRKIVEGSDKSDYVTVTTGEAPIVVVRSDEIETWQHNDTALALIQSNGTERSFEAFLTRVHDDGLALHHFGPADTEVPVERSVYDKAHDLASLYASYTSLDRPAIPVLSPRAEFVHFDQARGTIHFEEVLSDTIVVESIVDERTFLVIEELIFVRDEWNREYEMTRVTYESRGLVPADQFDSVFDPEQFPYQVIASL